MKVNGWTLYKGTLFEILEDRLKDEVEALKNTSNYLSHPKAKLLKAIYKCTMEEIPKDPNNPCYRLGSKIRKKFKGYRRAKNYMPSRYRLFFRFDSRKKEIFYLWFNNESTLRKDGAKTDVYTVFRKMLENQTIPTKLKELRENSKS